VEQFDTLKGEFTCDKNYFLLINVHRLNIMNNNQKIYVEFTNESVAGQNNTVRCDITEFFGNCSYYFEEDTTKFDITDHEEYNMTKNFIQKLTYRDQNSKRKPKIGLAKLRLLIPRPTLNGKMTRDQWREFYSKDGIFTRGWDPKVVAAFVAERQREYNQAKEYNKKIDEENEYNGRPNAFARLFKVLKGTRIRLIQEPNNEQRNTSIYSENNPISIILWTLAIVQEAFISENDALKLKLKKSFVNYHQPYCCFKCGKVRNIIM